MSMVTPMADAVQPADVADGLGNGQRAMEPLCTDGVPYAFVQRVLHILSNRPKEFVDFHASLRFLKHLWPGLHRRRRRSGKR